MTRRKVLTVFGTRPEAIKLAPVIKRLQDASGFESVICATGQHRQMLDQVLHAFEIHPHYDLGIMQPNQDLSDVTVAALRGVKDVLQVVRPHLVLVQGDTTTAFAAALAAFYFRIPVGHVEAGLRTHNRYSPFPEETNRCMISAISEWHFAPTAWAADNLLREGIPREKVFTTGNTVVDALLAALDVIERDPGAGEGEEAVTLPGRDRRMILITGHRRESFGEGFRAICRAIKRLAETFPACEFVYPVHLNPSVRQPVGEILGSGKLPNIHLIAPLGYLPFVRLMTRAHLILTDSGGIQEEALTFGKPVLVMRDTTERPEGVDSGGVRLVGNNEETIYGACRRLLTDRSAYDAMVVSRNPYGDGQAAARIVAILEQVLAQPPSTPSSPILSIPTAVRSSDPDPIHKRP
jgi:UDP-N-acetylglucosamine 2-epimerase (non-hydrolysing)